MQKIFCPRDDADKRDDDQGGSTVMVDGDDSNLRSRSGSVPIELEADLTEIAFYQPINTINRPNKNILMLS